MFEMLVSLMDTARQLAKPRLVASKGTHPVSQESSVAMTCSSRTERSPTDLNGDFRTAPDKASLLSVGLNVYLPNKKHWKKNNSCCLNNFDGQF